MDSGRKTGVERRGSMERGEREGGSGEVEKLMEGRVDEWKSVL